MLARWKSPTAPDLPCAVEFSCEECVRMIVTRRVESACCDVMIDLDNRFALDGATRSLGRYDRPNTLRRFRPREGGGARLFP